MTKRFRKFLCASNHEIISLATAMQEDVNIWNFLALERTEPW